MKTLFLKSAAAAALLVGLASGASAQVAGSPGSMEFDVARNFLPASCGFTEVVRGSLVWDEATSVFINAAFARTEISATTVQSVTIGAPTIDNGTITAASQWISNSGASRIIPGTGSTVSNPFGTTDKPMLTPLVATIANPSVPTVFEVLLQADLRLQTAPAIGSATVLRVPLTCLLAAGV